MYFDSRALVDFCAEKKITVEQFLLCYLTHTQQYALIYKYCQGVRPFPKSLVENLVKRGFVINLNKNDDVYPDNLIITEEFTDDLKSILGEDSDEFWDAYPSEVSVGGKAFNGKSISREDLETIYRKKLLRAKTTHKEVMEALHIQTEHGTLGMGMKKWFETEQWNREDHTLDVTDDI